MEDTSRKDIRRILKTFGIRADEAMVSYLARNPEIESLKVRITLEDITDYQGTAPVEVLKVVVEDNINRIS